MDRRGSGNTHYQMRENLASIGNDFWFENEASQNNILILAISVAINTMARN